MEDVKGNISKNLIALRKSRKFTQQDIAEKMNYSDKAVSRWELGESLPDISVLIKLCELYGVDFEWLIHEHNELPRKKMVFANRLKIFIVLLFAVCCYTIATIVYVYGLLINDVSNWKLFVYALPVCFFITMLFSHKWWMRPLTFSFQSATLWSLLGSVFIYLLPEKLIWPIFLVGLPLQAILVLLFLLRKNN